MKQEEPKNHNMGYITVWACGDLTTASEVCLQLRLLGLKARVHDSRNGVGTVWRRGPRVIVGDGEELGHIDTTGSSELLAFGLAGVRVFETCGGTTLRRPPGLLPAIRTLTCRRERGVLGARGTHFPVDAHVTDYDVDQMPFKGWEIEAVEADMRPAVITGLRTVLCFSMPQGPSLVAMLDRVTHMWGLHRSDPVERALDRAIQTTAEHIKPGVRVVLGYSGGLTSTVSAYILRKVIGKRMLPCFVKTGLDKIPVTRGTLGGVPLEVIDLQEEVGRQLNGMTKSDERRKRLGRMLWEACENKYPGCYLAQGATYSSILHKQVRPQAQTLNIVHPLETLFREEVEMIAKKCKLEIISPDSSFSGLSDPIKGPFSWEAVELARRVDVVLEKAVQQSGLASYPGCKTRYWYEVDVWDEVPRVVFGIEELTLRRNWYRTEIPEIMLDRIVDDMCDLTEISNLRVARDLTRETETAAKKRR